MKSQKSKNENIAVFILILFIIILLCGGSFLFLEGINLYLNGEKVFGWFSLTCANIAFVYVAIYLVSLVHKNYNL